MTEKRKDSPYTPSGSGDEPQTGTRSDTGITSSETRAANDPTQDVTGTAAEGATGTGTSGEE